MSKVRVLIVYYSLTKQTEILIKRFVSGLEHENVTVVLERITPIKPYEVPFRTNSRLGIAMVATFFRKRMAIQPVTQQCFGSWEGIVLAGPTWSYNPSGPMLDFLDRYGKQVCGGQVVVPFISCRAYWFINYWSLKRQLRQYGATVEEPVVFVHPIREPWRSVGLLLKLRGMIARKKYAWVRQYYPRYGHSDAQRIAAKEAGRQLAARLLGS